MIPQIAPEAPTTGDERRPDECARRPGEPGHDIEERVAPVPEVVLERRADDPEDEHVHPEMQHVPSGGTPT